MGGLRFFLSIAVIIGHSYPVFDIKLCGGVTAVQAFFILSGFFTFLSLSEKYKIIRDYKAFIISRIIRIYPIYLAALIASILVAIIITSVFKPFSLVLPYYKYGNELNLYSLATCFILNVSIIGQEILTFMALDPITGFFYFDPCFWKHGEPFLWSFILVPQAWALSLILLFYLIAPFLIRMRVSILLCLLLASLFLRFALYSNGLYQDPWNYRFFPTELALFLLGGISFHLHLFLKGRFQPSILMSYTALAAIYLFTIFYSFIPDTYIQHFSLKQWLYYISLGALIPIGLIENKTDRYLGELSLPIYLFHFLLIHILFNYAAFVLGLYDLQIARKYIESYLTIFLISSSVLASIIINKYLQEPVEKIRKRARMIIHQPVKVAD